LVLSQSTPVTDGQTHGQTDAWTDRQNYESQNHASIAARAVIKIFQIKWKTHMRKQGAAKISV